MKSKAQEYADATKLAVAMKPEPHEFGKVLEDGRLKLYDGFLTTEQALDLRNWLTDTFDVPKQTHYPLVGRD